MITESIIFITVLIALIVGTYSDFRWREVPDWLSFGLIFAGFGLRLIFTIIYKDHNYILNGIYGFIAMFIIAIIMFYAGQWGGGDSKMIMGLGALIGLPLTLSTFLLGFLINTIIFGSLFGIFFSVYLVANNWSSFIKEFNRRWKKKNVQKWFVWGVTIILIIISTLLPFTLRLPLITVAGLIFISFYVFIYLKSVEKVCMLKLIPPEELTEGDWIAEEVKIGKKYICGPKDLGIEKDQIKQLIALKKKKKVSKILIKVGIPFVPSFLIAFIVTYIWGNFVFAFLGLA